MSNAKANLIVLGTSIIGTAFFAHNLAQVPCGAMDGGITFDIFGLITCVFVTGSQFMPNLRAVVQWIDKANLAAGIRNLQGSGAQPTGAARNMAFSWDWEKDQ